MRSVSALFLHSPQSLTGKGRDMKDELPEDFYRPSPPLTVSLLKASQGIPPEDESVPPEPLLLEVREDIALRLWGCLAGLARACTVARGEDRCVLSIDEAFPRLSQRMQRRLVIPPTRYGRGLVEGPFLGSFFDWLYKKREYPAGWGVMRFDGHRLAFSDVHVPRFLEGDFEKAESARREQRRGRSNRAYYAE